MISCCFARIDGCFWRQRCSATVPERKKTIFEVCFLCDSYRLWTWVRNKMSVNEASFKDNGGNDHLFLHPVRIVIYPRLLWHFHCWFGCGYLASKWMTNEKTHTRWAPMIAINWVISPCKWPTGVKKTLLIGGYNPICNLEPASSEFATFLGGEQVSQINSR